MNHRVFLYTNFSDSDPKQLVEKLMLRSKKIIIYASMILYTYIITRIFFFNLFYFLSSNVFQIFVEAILYLRSISNRETISPEGYSIEPTSSIYLYFNKHNNFS